MPNHIQTPSSYIVLGNFDRWLSGETKNLTLIFSPNWKWTSPGNRSQVHFRAFRALICTKYRSEMEFGVLWCTQCAVRVTLRTDSGLWAIRRSHFPIRSNLIEFHKNLIEFHQIQCILRALNLMKSIENWLNFIKIWSDFIKFSAGHSSKNVTKM